MHKVPMLKQKLLLTASYLAVAALFYFLPISCIFLELFNIPCPGCGMTRALLFALRLNFTKAFEYHPMFWSVPILYLYFLYDGSLFKQKTLNRAVFAVIAVGFLVCWIIKL